MTDQAHNLILQTARREAFGAVISFAVVVLAFGFLTVATATGIDLIGW